MAKGNKFTLEDIEKKGFKDDGSGNYKKKDKAITDDFVMIKYGDGQRISFKPMLPFENLKNFEGGFRSVYFKNMTIADVFKKAEEEEFIFIPGDVPSLKNSKQLFKNKRTGKNFITSSDACKEYIDNTKIHWQVFRHRFKEMIKHKTYPLTIQLIFIRSEKRMFDYGNISQIVWDCMTGSIYYKKTKNKELNKAITKRRLDFSWIDDDDCDHLIPNFAAGYGYDPKLPGVIIKVL